MYSAIVQYVQTREVITWIYYKWARRCWHSSLAELTVWPIWQKAFFASQTNQLRLLSFSLCIEITVVPDEAVSVYLYRHIHPSAFYLCLKAFHLQNLV